MKKILHISKYYYPFKGGTEQTARDCVNSLKEVYDQRVICFNDNIEDVQDNVEGIDVTRAGCFAKISSQSISISYFKLLKKAIQEYIPDLIIFHYPNPFVAIILLKLIPYKCKLVLYWHLDITRQKFLKLFFLSQNKRLLSRANKIIATSQAYIDGSHYLSLNKDKCVVVSNCINEDRLKMTPNAESIKKRIMEQNKGKTICFSCGRHTRYKGYDYLIKAAHMLNDSYQFYIAGIGEETKRLRKLAGNDHKIHFLGVIDDDMLKAYLSSMDIFCFPSVTKNEAFGIALAEAMYYGKPAVTFTIPGSGVNYVSINNVTGIEIPNGNVEKYADGIKMLATDADLRERMGSAAKKRIEENLLYAQFKESIKEIINSLD